MNSDNLSFDLITFFGVIEHTINHGMYLEKAREFLNEDGMIFVEVPRHESLTTILDLIFPDMGTRHLEELNTFTAFQIVRLLHC